MPISIENQIIKTTETLKQYTVGNQWNEFLRPVQKLAVYARADVETGRVQCCTCGDWYVYKDKNIQGGHYIPRDVRNGGVCFSLLNINPQCTTCNNQGHGKSAEYAAWLGPAKVRALEIMRNGPLPFRTAGRHDTEKMVRYLCYQIRPVLNRVIKRLG